MNEKFDYKKNFITDNEGSPMVMVEANAGTGKTFSIENLYSELIGRENGPTVEQILVVTFTEAATAELKDRIRTQLNKVAPSSVQARKALALFDQAPIFTIHGFCKRALENFAFESGADFDAQLDDEGSQLLSEAVLDFYNRKVAAGEKTPELNELQSLAKKIYSEPAPKLVPDLRNLSCEDLERAQRNVDNAQKELIDAVMNVQLPANTRAKKLLNALNRIQSLVGETDGNLVSAILAEKDLFDATAQRNAPNIYDMKKKLLDAKKEAKKQADKAKEAECPAELVRYLDDDKNGFAARKKRTNSMTFNDLLTKMREALEGDVDDKFAEALRSEYKVVIVDEFQDTDSTQYRIFEKVFNKPGHLFFMFGDPKQAIYSFRSGDLATYQMAKDAADKKGSVYQLAANFRSSEKMVEAVNALFNFPQSFLDRDICYVDSVCGNAETPEKLKHRLRYEGREIEKPMRLLWMTGDAEGNSISKSAAGDKFLTRAAQEIALMLNDAKYEIIPKDAEKGRRLRPSDFAVLVETNAQCKTVKAGLNKLGVPAVILKSGNVFNSQTATDMAFILEAILRPSSVRLVKAALLTEWCGMSVKDVAKFEGDELAKKCDQLAELGETWREHGVAAVLTKFLRQFNGMANIARAQDFERRIVNWRHLVELLRGEETEASLKPEGVLKFLHDNISGGDENEAYEERLESDSNAVTVLTVFKSKGLEYPIVLCPTISTGFTELKKDRVSFVHGKNEATNAEELILPIGKSEKDNAYPQANFEHFSERLRLLYVAVTRSACECILLGGNICYEGSGKSKGHQQNAFNYLAWKRTHRDAVPDAQNMPILTAPSADAMKDIMDVAQEANCDSYVLSNVPRYDPEVDDSQLNPAETAPKVVNDFAVMSYSGMVNHNFESVAGKSGGDKSEDGDDDESYDEDEKIKDVLPGGKNVGTAVHKVFELCDFLKPEGLEPLVAKTLAQNGITSGKRDDSEKTENDKARENRVLEIVKSTLEAKLPDLDISLNTVKRSDTKREWTFFSSVTRKVDIKKFKDSFEGLSFKQNAGKMTGCITGQIDLIFRVGEKYYFADWKTDGLDDYSSAALDKKMTTSGYRFQAYVYAIALRDFLKARLGDAFDFSRHFGGGYYFFVRGIGDGKGIYRFNPTEAELAEYAACFKSDKEN